MATVFRYGGGRQTVAMVVLIAKGVLPRPDVIVMADTSRENPMTWVYLDTYVQPLCRQMGMEVNVASHDLATVDMYSPSSGVLIPAFTVTGKLRTWCSNEWKMRVCDRWLRNRAITEGETWLGMAFEERRRWVKTHGRREGKWTVVCPLVDLLITTDVCKQIIQSFGWPVPAQSSCWMCPHKRNAEWRLIRDEWPEYWYKACEVDEEIRANDEQGGLFLHHSRVPLRIADIDHDESESVVSQCTLGACFI